MKRLFIAAVAGLCAVGSAGAQDGGLAPTAPVVPPPVLQDGRLVAPSGGPWGTGGPRLMNRSPWSPVRSPVAAAGEYGHTGYPDGGACGPAGCDRDRSRGSCLERLKAWLCFNYSPSALPKCRPAPYVTPLQGLFTCTSGGCGTGGCAAGGYPHPAPAVLPPPPPMTNPMPAPVPPPVKSSTSAGAVSMPGRGSSGAATAPGVWQNGPAAPAATVWQTAPAGSDFGTARGPNGSKPGTGPVVPTGYKAPK